jgi:hypothetical protein
MFGSLIRWVGHGAGSERSRRGAATAPRFALQLESLEGRAAPGSLKGEVAACGTRKAGDEIPAILRQETPSPYQAGYEVALTDGAGHQVDLMGGASKPGVGGGSGALGGGSEVTLFGGSKPGGTIGSGALGGGSEVTLFGGSKPGGVDLIHQVGGTGVDPMAGSHGTGVEV